MYYLLEIGRKINSKTICRIKNLFVTTRVRGSGRVCVSPSVHFLIKFVYKNRGELEK